MTSTNMFQGLDSESKPSSRVLRPPGGGSSNLFGGYEDDSSSSRRPNKMASTVFAAPSEDPQSVPKRSNPPGQTCRPVRSSVSVQGGKSSGIFGESEPAARTQKPAPPGGSTSNIFGAAESASVHSPSRSHPNKPKDNLSVGPEPESPAPEAKVSQPEVKEPPAPAPVPAKEEPAAVSAPPEPEPVSSSLTDENSMKNHEPHLGPKPRSHNRVLNPPGGKSSVVFY
uniref:Jupiter microtubule associated homolog 2 n=1 Tax=Anabas testudineus TaxID=64144 RepID=A0A7N6FBB1_ANATE